MEGKKNYATIKLKNRLIQNPTYYTRVYEKYFYTKYLSDSLFFLNNADYFCQNSVYKSYDDLKTFLQDSKIKYILKVDISNFYNSIDVNRFKKNVLSKFINDDGINFCNIFFAEGFPTGSTLSNIFSDIYLLNVLKCFDDNNYHYIRYRDDFLFFFESYEDSVAGLSFIKKSLATIGLNVNEKCYIKEKTDKSNSFLGFNFYYNDALFKVFIRCKKSKLRKIEQKYKDYSRLLYSSLQDNKDVNSILYSMNSYTLSLFGFYSKICTNLSRDFKFVNRVLDEISSVLGFVEDGISSREKFNNMYIRYDSFLSNPKEIYNSIYFMKIQN